MDPRTATTTVSIPNHIIYRSPEQIAFDAVKPFITLPPASCGRCRYCRNGDCILIHSWDPHPKVRAKSDTCDVQTRYSAALRQMQETDPTAATSEGILRKEERDGN